MREEALKIVQRWRSMALRYEQIGSQSLTELECKRYAAMHATLSHCADELERIAQPQPEKS